MRWPFFRNNDEGISSLRGPGSYVAITKLNRRRHLDRDFGISGFGSDSTTASSLKNARAGIRYMWGFAAGVLLAYVLSLTFYMRVYRHGLRPLVLAFCARRVVAGVPDFRSSTSFWVRLFISFFLRHALLVAVVSIYYGLLASLWASGGNY